MIVTTLFGIVLTVLTIMPGMHLLNHNSNCGMTTTKVMGTSLLTPNQKYAIWWPALALK
jgi:hypothetical protein